jgi:hypothetical protein
MVDGGGCGGCGGGGVGEGGGGACGVSVGCAGLSLMFTSGG